MNKINVVILLIGFGLTLQASQSPKVTLAEENYDEATGIYSVTFSVNSCKELTEVSFFQDHTRGTNGVISTLMARFNGIYEPVGTHNLILLTERPDEVRIDDIGFITARFRTPRTLDQDNAQPQRPT